MPISSGRWAVLEPLIDAALDLPPEERDAYFDRASDGDPSLRAQLARLVAACERDDALLDAPAGERFAALLEETPPRILNGRFVIEREIGRGGMAVVYLAHDRKHDRQVAVKILGPDAAAAIGADRFDREIKFAARLHHPNIVPLYDSGDEQGWLYYVMPVMHGGSLRQRLASSARLPIEAVQRILRDIAAALSYAHDQNVVHRDVKPENILFDGERAMLADFGVARPPLSVGASAGTPEYMSPEQADGRGPVDARSDVYSLAAVVQEMLGRITNGRERRTCAHVAGGRPARRAKCTAARPRSRRGRAVSVRLELRARVLGGVRGRRFSTRGATLGGGNRFGGRRVVRGVHGNGDAPASPQLRRFRAVSSRHGSTALPHRQRNESRGWDPRSRSGG